MVSESRAKELILDALENVKSSEDTYSDLDLNEKTVVLGRGGPFDSIAFTAFATDFEEKMEDETGSEFVLRVDEILSQSKGKSNLTVEDLAKFVSGKAKR